MSHYHLLLHDHDHLLLQDFHKSHNRRLHHVFVIIIRITAFYAWLDQCANHGLSITQILFQTLRKSWWKFANANSASQWPDHHHLTGALGVAHIEFHFKIIVTRVNVRKSKFQMWSKSSSSHFANIWKSKLQTFEKSKLQTGSLSFFPSFSHARLALRAVMLCLQMMMNTIRSSSWY